MARPIYHTAVLDALYAAGAHIVLAKPDKVAAFPEWQKFPPTLAQAKAWDGLLGVKPVSLDLVVVDCDGVSPERAVEVLGEPLASIPSSKPGRGHVYYRKPEGQVGNRKWADPNTLKQGGDIRCSRGYAILWDAAAVVKLLPQIPDAPRVQLDKLPKWNKKAEEVRNAPVGARNQTLNDAAFSEALQDGDAKPLEDAARANGLPPDEVQATVGSAKEGAKDAFRNPRSVAAAVARPDWGARDFSGLLVKYRGDRLMVVSYDEKPTPKRPTGGRGARVYVVNTDTGLWADDEVVLREWLTEIAREVVISAFDHLEGRQAIRALRESKRLKDTTVNEAIRRIPDVMLGVDRDERVVEADMRHLDLPGRYLGTDSGVVDLKTGLLLPPEEGRKHKVTRSTNVRLPQPGEEEHEGVKALMAHYPTDVETFVWRWFGRALWGMPSQEFLMIVGKGKWGHEGKTTIKETMLAAVGGYAGAFPETMMRPRTEAGPTPELQPAVENRLLISEECVNWRFEAERFKALTGGGGATFPVEPKFQAILQKKVTASLVLMANAPPLNLPGDPALLKRLRYVELIRPTDIRKDLRDLHQTHPLEFLPHVLARLIREAKACQPPDDVDVPAHVREVTKAKIAELLGALYIWVEEVVKSGDGNLGRQVLWEAWAKVHRADPKKEYIAGARQDHLRDGILALYGQKIGKVWDGERAVNGWKGIVLTDEADRDADGISEMVCTRCGSAQPLEKLDLTAGVCIAACGDSDDAPPSAPAGHGQPQRFDMGADPMRDHIVLDDALRAQLARVEKVRAKVLVLLEQQGETDPGLSPDVIYADHERAGTLQEELPTPVRVRVAILNRHAQGLRLFREALKQEHLTVEEVEELGGAGYITKFFALGTSQAAFPIERANTDDFVGIVKAMRLEARERIAARRSMWQRLVNEVQQLNPLRPKRVN